MAGIRSRNTRPEVFLRKLLHRTGFRFRLGSKIGKIKPDIVLPKWRTALFIHGCFWHGHEHCPLYRLPKSNSAFWTEKVTANRERDARVSKTLRDAGWNVVTVWECSLKGRSRLPTSSLLSELISRICRPTGTDIEGISDRTVP
jgi:DNA mismatch endonuclease (patch repair protein)